MIHCRVQHHPSRADLLPDLLEKLAPLQVEVVADSGPDMNPWRGYQKCLTDIPDCSHLLIIQEDAIPCMNFAAALERVAKANPNNTVVLFLGGLPKKTGMDALKALKRGVHYSPVWFRDFMPVVAVLWPKAKAEHFLEWAKTEKFPGAFPRSDDAVAGRWMLRNKEQVFVTIPSLVQHPDTHSIIHPNRAKSGADKGRVALLYCEGDPLELDWARP